MAVSPNTRVCTHIKVNGIRCGSPSLRQEVFCYFHPRMIRGVRTPLKSRLHPIANFEDPQAIPGLAHGSSQRPRPQPIDVARARLILRALSIAARNANKTRFDCWQSDMVKEVPEYPSAQPVAGPFAVPAAQAAALTNIRKPQPDESGQDRIDNAFQTAPADVHRNARRKPPASVKTASRTRAASRSRTDDRRVCKDMMWFR